MAARKPKRAQLETRKDTLADLTTGERVRVTVIQQSWTDESLAGEIHDLVKLIAGHTRDLKILETLQAIRTLTGSLTAACASPVTADDSSEQQPAQTAQSAANAAG